MEDFPVEEERQMRGNCKKVFWEQCLGRKGNFYHEPRSRVFNIRYVAIGLLVTPGGSLVTFKSRGGKTNQIKA